ncbi:MAG: hypothetical protein SO119_09530 [Phascolarctobacterium sp.]|nr:hypothetical protein [Phascolarctobacterium sp.]
MTRKNYLKDMQPDNKKMRAGSLSEYLQALQGFLRKPKTRFDLVDRGRFVILLVIVIILLQKVVENFSN